MEKYDSKGMKMDKKPGLAILIGQALADKGKSKMSSLIGKEDDKEDYDDHLMAISEDLITAVHDKDASAVKDLLQEAFDCMEAMPHEEYDE